MTLAAWIAEARRLRAICRASSPLYERRARHWSALSLGAIRAGDRESIANLLSLLQDPDNRASPWGRPGRGHRGGTQWEWVNVEARNRIARLDQLADRESIPAGANWRGANAT